ncbi:hypothetical protein CHS0354_029171 [Potamilus streckersoni]|uniref:Uncharacterized protein n=1 Tax=Potamilus streckersoni TaxID=2493646 RepID=A0AAE0VK10_9BIVA|nr:hypothetical protein CHS0354_029171 [Potamilus streckersoni]
MERDITPTSTVCYNTSDTDIVSKLRPGAASIIRHSLKLCVHYLLATIPGERCQKVNQNITCHQTMISSSF